MKYSLLSSILALAIGTAVADNCNVPLLYCGHSLLGKGNYQPQIDQCLFDNNHLTLDNGKSVLFGCIGGPNGVIQFLQDCGLNQCMDNGNGKNDTCF